jgi:hypothetical protein
MIPKLRIMGRHVALTRRYLGLALVAAILAASMFAPVSVSAAQDGAPFIEGVGSAVGAEITIDAKINPEGLETSYEIGLECSPCGHGDQWAAGTLPAVHETREVKLALTGLQARRRYWFDVRAVNPDGETSRRGETIEIPESSSPFPEGTGGSGIVSDPPSEAIINELRAIGIREEERRTKEQEEQKARELVAPLPSELEHDEEQPPAAASMGIRLPACLVPAIKGDTLTTARRVLARVHCGLGVVHRSAHYHGTLYIRAQGVPAGKHLIYGTRITLWVGAKKRDARPASLRTPASPSNPRTPAAATR